MFLPLWPLFLPFHLPSSEITELAGIRRGFIFFFCLFLSPFFILDFSLSVSSFEDFAQSCGFNLSSCEKREKRRGEENRKEEEGGKKKSEWVEMKPARDERVRW